MPRTERRSSPASRRSEAPARLTPDLFRFLSELRENNNRHWFERNKARYLSVVREPLQDFIEAFGPRLHKISPHLVADPRANGGSLFRIYRDARFSRDKTPYKTHAGIQFRHALGKDVHAPGLYLHLEPGNVFAAAGMWHPDGDSLRAIRTAIVTHPERWRRAVGDRSFRRAYRVEGRSLTRAPRGFDADHPLVEDLKRKDFIAVAGLSEEEALAPGFVARFARLCARSDPFMRFLTTSVGLRW
jgi:uncharacterized protein (TIGR02453 family)